jgi:hypothetical protein
MSGTSIRSSEVSGGRHFREGQGASIDSGCKDRRTGAFSGKTLLLQQRWSRGTLTTVLTMPLIAVIHDVGKDQYRLSVLSAIYRLTNHIKLISYVTLRQYSHKMNHQSGTRINPLTVLVGGRTSECRKVVKTLGGVRLPEFYGKYTEDVNAWITIIEDQFYLA